MLYLIGVDHSVQHDGDTIFEGPVFEKLRGEFVTFLCRVAREKGATVIAEEWSQDAVTLNKNHGATKFTGAIVASKLKIKHQYCDPGNDEREQLGITKNSEREQFWLEKLKKLKGEKIIFILGAKHVQEFSDGARNAGFSIDVVDEYYGKEFFPPL